MKNLQRSIIYAVCATLCWSTVATAFKYGLRYFHHDTADLLLWSVLLCVLFLYMFSLLQRKRLSNGLPSGRQILNSAFLGALNPFFYYLVLFKAYDLLPASEAQPLNYTWPIVLSILSALVFRKRINIFQIIAMLIALAGIVIISGRGQLTLKFTHLKGVGLAVGSSFIWATYWIVNMKDKRPPLLKMRWNFLFGLIYLVLYLFIRGNILMPSYSGIICAIWIGLCEMGLAFVLWMHALELAPRASMISHVVYLSPFISFIFIYLLLKEENVMGSPFVGLCLITGGVVIGSMSGLLAIRKK